MRPARDEPDFAAALGQLGAEIAAHPARTHYGDPHLCPRTRRASRSHRPAAPLHWPGRVGLPRTHQNTNLTAKCSSLASCAMVTTPKFGAPKTIRLSASPCPAMASWAAPSRRSACPFAVLL